MVFAGINDTFSHTAVVMGVIVAVAVILFFILLAASTVSCLVGPTGPNVFERVMGLIIAAIGVEFILDGIAGHFVELNLIHP